MIKKIASTIAFSLIFLICTAQDRARVFATAGGGLTGLYPSVELQTGVRYHDYFTSIGYTAIKDDGKPVLFNVRAGYIFQEKFIVYAGAVESRRSLEMKQMNYKTWQVGGAYAFCFYSFGSFYLSPTYTHKEGVSAIIGMTINVFKN